MRDGGEKRVESHGKMPRTTARDLFELPVAGILYGIFTISAR